MLAANDIKISTDGKYAWRDNVFVLPGTAAVPSTPVAVYPSAKGMYSEPPVR